MHLLTLGGSSNHLGGVEAFCERSAQALARRNAGWRTHHIATSTAYLTPKRLSGFFGGLSQLARYRRHKPDLVWLQYVNLPDLAYLLLARLLGMRVMVTPHLGSNWRSQQQPVLRWLSCALLGLADRIATISKTQQLEIALPKGTPRSLIRNFLPEEILTGPLPRPGDASSVLELVHSARLSADKGTFMVVELSARLRDAGVPFRTRITGGADAETYARLDAMIEEHRLGEHVKVLGRVPEDELLETLRSSDVLVHLSRIDSYPLILLEGLACATLPVAMELAGARDMVEIYDGAIVSQARPVDEAADFLIGADLADLRERARAEAGRVRADYSWDHCAAALEAALAACVSRSRAATEPLSA